MSTNTKYKIGFYGYILVTVMTLISLIVYVSNVSTPYYEDMNVTVLIMMICALVALVGVVALTGKTQNKVFAIIVDFLRVLAAVLLIMSGVEFIGMRVESFGYIFGSNLEMGNEAAFSAGSQAILAIILFVVTWLLAIIASFFKVGVKEA